jgi:hypothetical protein
MGDKAGENWRWRQIFDMENPRANSQIVATIFHGAQQKGDLEKIRCGSSVSKAWVYKRQ